MFPESYEPPVATATTSWSTSPFSRGCYPYASVDTLPDDFAKMGEPTHGGRVHFGGDACGDVHVGYVEGAMESGEAAASAILKILEGRGA